MVKTSKNYAQDSAFWKPDEQTTRNSCETSTNVALNPNISYQSSSQTQKNPGRTHWCK
ncbi:hypothetical protein BYT27DRAFT_7196180 [Phlegmacium glaucopus]|nr:hypothetical protein BYT27DRAFT_7196180 [Phlegmacium glaucopus]